MSPTIVLGPDGKAILALGSAGGPRIIMHVMKTLVGVLDWGLPVDQAIALPNIFLSGNALLVEQGTSLDGMRDRLLGKAACREIGCKYVWNLGGRGSLNK